jgi:hypothetical protein
LADLLTGSPARERKERSHREIDQEVARKAALAYEKWRRDAESRKEEAARENARQRRERTIEKVQAAWAPRRRRTWKRHWPRISRRRRQRRQRRDERSQLQRRFLAR